MGTRTKEDYYQTPEFALVELIDGEFYQRVHPDITHQDILGNIAWMIGELLDRKKGSAHLIMGPLATEIGEETIVEPDIIVYTDKEKICDRCYLGGPDLVIEIVSGDDLFHDYVTKLKIYKDAAGTMEYWVVNPYERVALIYTFGGEHCAVRILGFDMPLTSMIMPEISIDLSSWNMDYLIK